MSDLSPNMKAALLAYAVYSSNFHKGCSLPKANAEYFRDQLDPLERIEFWKLCNLLDSIACVAYDRYAPLYY